MDVLVGTVGRAHGLKGAVVVQVHTDRPDERFAPGAVVRLPDGDELAVAGAGRVGAAFVVRFVQVNDRTAAERLGGQELWADIPDDLDLATSDEFHDARLIGADVRDEAGDSVGTLKQILHLPAQDVLVVDVAGAERMVPFVRDLVPEVNVAESYVTVRAIPGLLDDEATDAR